MSPYLVEVVPKRDSAEMLSARARAVCGPTRFLRSVYVPEDDRWFLLYEGTSAAEVTAAAERADVCIISIAVAQTSEGVKE